MTAPAPQAERLKTWVAFAEALPSAHPFHRAVQRQPNAFGRRLNLRNHHARVTNLPPVRIVDLESVAWTVGDRAVSLHQKPVRRGLHHHGAGAGVDINGVVGHGLERAVFYEQ